ncbi:YesL family protein [Enterococcus sp. JM9B]|uniref:YesL family protein n=1 Tax=Enterococcus sp. JM9B TaxID=1857216 RepID=UPI001374D940|nr:DUF624 domain-containing protein [Enterococcus sp. JM9B]KAF1303186.1 hypothetical protein BAU16_05280 [Enterococcus sp. JM9B]
MESSGIQRLFYLSWTVIKLNLIFVLLTVMGGVVFGIGPAFQTINDLLEEARIDYQEITFKKAFEHWKRNFKKGNRDFLVMATALFIIGYNLFLAVQLTGILWLLIAFLLFSVLLLLSVMYLYMIFYETSYSIGFFDLMKLAFISVFLNFGVFLRVIFGIGSVVILSWYFKGLLLFATFALILMWCGYTTRKNRSLVDGKLEANETTSTKVL